MALPPKKLAFSISTSSFAILSLFRQIHILYIKLVISSSFCENMKRKRDAESSVKPSKGPVDEQDPDQDAISNILLLENSILESRKNYNSIVKLLDHAREHNGSSGKDTAAVVALYRVFCRLMALGNLTKNAQASKEEHTIVQWLRERLEEYEEALIGQLRWEDVTKQVAALGLLMRLIKEKARHLNGFESVGSKSRLFQRLVQELLANRNGSTTIDEFVDKYVSKHADIRHHTFVSIS